MNESNYRRSSQLGLSLIAVGQSWKRLFKQTITEQGLGDLPVLPLSTLVQDGDGIRQYELAARLGVENTAVVRVLDNLQREGLVRREEDSSDRRAKLIFLTDKGRELAGRIVKLRKDMREEMLKDVSLADIQATERVLKQLMETLSTKNNPAR